MKLSKMSLNFIPTIVKNADGTESVENVPVMNINETNAFTTVNNIGNTQAVRKNLIKERLKNFKPRMRRNS